MGLFINFNNIYSFNFLRVILIKIRMLNMYSNILYITLSVLTAYSEYIYIYIYSFKIKLQLQLKFSF